MQLGDIASRAMSIRASKEIEILNQKKEEGEDIASDSVIKSLSIQLKSAKDQLEEFNQEYENIVSTHRAVAQEIKGGNAIGDLIAYNTGRERVVDKPKLTLFERIFGRGKTKHTSVQGYIGAIRENENGGW